MKRFTIFPLVLGTTTAFLSLLCWIELAIMLGGFVALSKSYSMGEVSLIWEESCVYGYIVGALLSLILATWDLVRNCRNETATARLLPNLFWCGCYALALIVANGILFAAFSYLTNARLLNSFGSLLPLFGIATLNFTAILWASIRSITTDDVLTPRVLRAKLRGRARLE